MLELRVLQPCRHVLVLAKHAPCHSPHSHAEQLTPGSPVRATGIAVTDSTAWHPAVEVYAGQTVVGRHGLRLGHRGIVDVAAGGDGRPDRL